MKLLRAGGEYLARRERWLWLGLVGTGIIPAAGFALGGSVAALAGAMAIPLWGGWLTSHLLRVRRGRMGELLVTEFLRQLSDDYCLVNDVLLGSGRGNIDHVLIGPCGVLVIETKRYSGLIRCYGDDWYVRGRRRKSASNQVKAAAVTVREQLRRSHPEARIGFVEAAVVFTDPLCRLQVRNARATVIRLSQLIEVVLALAQKRKMSPELAAELARTLADHAA